MKFISEEFKSASSPNGRDYLKHLQFECEKLVGKFLLHEAKSGYHVMKVIGYKISTSRPGSVDIFGPAASDIWVSVNTTANPLEIDQSDSWIEIEESKFQKIFSTTLHRLVDAEHSILKN